MSRFARLTRAACAIACACAAAGAQAQQQKFEVVNSSPQLVPAPAVRFGPWRPTNGADCPSFKVQYQVSVFDGRNDPEIRFRVEKTPGVYQGIRQLKAVLLSGRGEKEESKLPALGEWGSCLNPWVKPGAYCTSDTAFVESQAETHFQAGVLEEPTVINTILVTGIRYDYTQPTDPAAYKKRMESDSQYWHDDYFQSQKCSFYANVVIDRDEASIQQANAVKELQKKLQEQIQRSHDSMDASAQVTPPLTMKEFLSRLDAIDQHTREELARMEKDEAEYRQTLEKVVQEQHAMQAAAGIPSSGPGASNGGGRSNEEIALEINQRCKVDTSRLRGMGISDTYVAQANFCQCALGILPPGDSHRPQYESCVRQAQSAAAGLRSR